MGEYDFPSVADFGLSDDDVLAIELLMGVPDLDLPWPFKTIFLSDKSNPTENDARRGLCRALRSGKPPRALLMALANAFDPDGESALKIVLKKRNKGHSDWKRDLVIAYKIHHLRHHDGKSYGDAIKYVAELLNRDEKTVEKIYSKRLDEVIRLYDAGKPTTTRI